jgi:hypothetical protein
VNKGDEANEAAAPFATVEEAASHVELGVDDALAFMDAMLALSWATCVSKDGTTDTRKEYSVE